MHGGPVQGTVEKESTLQSLQYTKTRDSFLHILGSKFSSVGLKKFFFGKECHRAADKT